MAIRIVRLGSPRVPDEGLRVGTVRRPPRGVPKSEYATRDIYDVWLPNVAPSEPLVKEALGTKDEKSWKTFVRRYRAEMRGIPVEVSLGRREGLRRKCVVNLDNTHVVPKACLKARIGALSSQRAPEVKRALGYALDWAELKDVSART